MEFHKQKTECEASNSSDDDSINEVDTTVIVVDASKQEIDALTAVLDDVASQLERIKGFKLCSGGKEREAANSTASEWRKLERKNQ